ncbi:hypothetical protein MHM93_18965 [Pseudoalteromonas sp. MM17-2]|uniref:hypothetical protein n=1 Tax=Pseudoalteromonas sp. MM17-2 TaxID=2917753 RepID=UPI001EF6119C|nr:hypothetical protein [Pseudoalteromonas sp. MM17-2]MCG7546256.1 hypothetical protein [Pseudoalteromonas sp. MM17-2]
MTPSIINDVRTVLQQKGLDEIYINEKMHGFDGVTTNLEALARARFLDAEGRALLADRTVFTARELDGFFEVARAFSPLI